jgi:hypothetical protein
MSKSFRERPSAEVRGAALGAFEIKGHVVVL